MEEALWEFVDAVGVWAHKSYAIPTMAGRVLGWLLVCDPAEQTAAQIGEALEASAGSISGATGLLVRARLIDRLHIRGERADRFRLRPEAWDESVRDTTIGAARELFARALEALKDEPPERRRRLEELDMFYGWYESRMDALWEEWQVYKRTRGKS